MIALLNRRRRRATTLSWTGETVVPATVKMLAGLCVALALICLGLALAYQAKVRQVRCYAEAADLGLAPPGDCRTAR